MPSRGHRQEHAIEADTQASAHCLPEEGPREECGVFGIWAPGESVARITYFSLHALQHRGQESAGIAVANGGTIHCSRAMGLVSQAFTEESVASLVGSGAIGHTRYSTTGSSAIENAQPIVVETPHGPIAVAHNGNLVNTCELHDDLAASGTTFKTTNDSELIALLLARAHKGDIEETIAEVMPRLQGAYSLAVMTTTKVVGVRDPHGIRPLCLGSIGDNTFVIASESCAFTPTRARLIRDIEPGEMIVLDHRGCTEIQAVPTARHAMCLFEFIYFARPDSLLYHKSVHAARMRMGQALAREHPAPGADVVVPVPDTSTAAAIGYAQASKIPYNEGIIKNRYIQRTFIQPDQRMRELGAMIKYSPIGSTLADKRVVMVDDSIVRGTTTGKVVGMLFEAGAKEVHVRITAPPVRHPCFYGIDMPSEDELIAATHSVEAIRRHIGATSLGYLSLDAAVAAVGMHTRNFCRACFDGKYPIEIPLSVRGGKMMLEPVRKTDRDAA